MIEPLWLRLNCSMGVDAPPLDFLTDIFLPLPPLSPRSEAGRALKFRPFLIQIPQKRRRK
jgi:hypothetical protein